MVMLAELANLGTLDLIYVGVLGVSFIFAVLSLLGAEIGQAFDLGADIDHDGFHFIHISPFALALFGATFGLAGLITRLWLEMTPLPSIFWATVAGLVVGAGAQLFFIYVLSPTQSSHFSLSEDAVGRVATVLISIPQTGQGQIAYDNQSGRITLGARSSGGKAIHSGEAVVIEQIVGRVAFVRPADPHHLIAKPTATEADATS